MAETAQGEQRFKLTRFGKDLADGLQADGFIEGKQTMWATLGWFERDPHKENRLVSAHTKMGPNQIFDIIEWDEKGVKFFRRQHGSILRRTTIGPLFMEWEALEELGKSGESFESEQLQMLPEDITGILELRRK